MCPLKKKRVLERISAVSLYSGSSSFLATTLWTCQHPESSGVSRTDAIRNGHMGQGVRMSQGGPAFIAGREPAGSSQVDVAALPGDHHCPLLQQDKGYPGEISCLSTCEVFASRASFGSFWHLGLVMCYFLTLFRCMSLGVQMLVTAQQHHGEWWPLAECQCHPYS